MKLRKLTGAFLIALLTVGVVSCTSPLDAVIPEDPTEVPPHEPGDEEAFRALPFVTLLG